MSRQQISIDYPAIHPIANWSNIPSVWYYYSDEFRIAFTSVYPPESKTVFDVLSKFREGKTLKKDKENSITIKELLSLPDDVKGKKLEAYYNQLRAAMVPPKELQLPYSSGYKLRILELVHRMCLTDPKFKDCLDIKKAVYKLVRGYYEDDSIQYPFAIEGLAIPYKISVIAENNSKDYPSRFLGSVNYSISPKGNDFETAARDDTYDWIKDVKKGGKKLNLLRSSNSMIGVLNELGFEFDAISHEDAKIPSVILVNVISPRVDYYGEDKSKINVEPFKDKLVEVAKQISKSIPTFHAAGFTFEKTGERKSVEATERNKMDAIEYLRDFLRKRYFKIKLDPSVKKTDSVTKQGVFYRIRPKMLEDKFKPDKDWGKTRTYLVGAIDDVVKELWKGEVDREDDLGITAGARGIMYYDGQQIPITIDNFKDLAKKGVAAIVCEKEGIVKLLAPYAAKHGVALVNTRGHLVKYIIKYIKERKDQLGLIVAMLVDYDKDGQEIAKKEAELHTLIIGVLQETIEWFQKEGNITKFSYKKFSIADVSEEYNPDIRKVDDEFLKTNRIELDSIISIVGAEAFWEYIAYRLQLKEIFSPKGFDYSDGEVSMPESKDLYFKEMNDLQDLVDRHIEYITESKRNEIIDNDLAAADKLIEVEPKEKEIKETLRPIVANDRIMKLAASKLKALTDELRNEIDKENKAAAA